MRFLSVSKNQLKDLSEILYLPFLVTLNASENQIGSIDFLSVARDSLHYLQAVTLTKNKLTCPPPPPQTILHLDLSKNKLTSTAGIANMPKLQQLELGENEISEVASGL